MTVSRKIRTWLGRILLSAGLAASVIVGAQGMAQADDGAAYSGQTTATADPTWE